MTKLVSLQLLWIGLGAAYNLVSLWWLQNKGMALTSTPPMMGLIVMCAFIPVVLLGLSDYQKSYLVLNTLVILFILYGGVLVHLLAFASVNNLEGYASAEALILGVAINVFGVAVGVTASWRTLQLMSA